MVKKYETVRMWHEKGGSFKYYIEAQVKKAHETNAPFNATYMKQDGTWSTVDDIKDIENRPDMYDFIPYLSKEQDNGRD